jgi:hypothetical protein
MRVKTTSNGTMMMAVDFVRRLYRAKIIDTATEGCLVIHAFTFHASALPRFHTRSRRCRHLLTTKRLHSSICIPPHTMLDPVLDPPLRQRLLVSTLPQADCRPQVSFAGPFTALTASAPPASLTAPHYSDHSHHIRSDPFQHQFYLSLSFDTSSFASSTSDKYELPRTQRSRLLSLPSFQHQWIARVNSVG